MKIQYLIIPILVLTLLGGGAAIYFYTKEEPLPIAGQWGNETVLLRFFDDGRLIYKNFSELSNGGWSRTGDSTIQLVYELNEELIKEEADVIVTEDSLSLLFTNSEDERREMVLTKDHPGPEEEEDKFTMKGTEAEVMVLQLASRLGGYEFKHKMLPTSEQGLKALVTKPVTPPVPENWTPQLKQLPNDPWGNPFQYRYTPAKDGKSGTSFDIWSVGPDGASNTKDDIGNWNVSTG